VSSVNRNKPKRGSASESSYSLMEFMQEFPDDATCLDYLWRERFSKDGTHAHCDKCGTVRTFHRISTRPSYSCAHCGHHIYPLSGTIFHKSATALNLWFYAIFLMSQTRCGVSAKTLERTLGVTYKTAWRMFTLIRKHLMTDDDWPKLKGTVEVDEMFVGGKGRGKGRAMKNRNKTPVIGIVERGGKVRAFAMTDASATSILPYVNKHIHAGSTIYTDEFTSYGRLGRLGYMHRQVKHGARQYVDGDVHTNTVENLFWNIRGGLRGTYHYVSRKHLQGYLNEFVFRLNDRDDSVPMFRTLLGRAAQAQ
jgi:transposase